MAMLFTVLVTFAGSERALGNPALLPAEAFGTLPIETDVVLSPDGHWIAWADHKDPQTKVVIFDLVASKQQRVIHIPERGKLRSLAWNDSQTLLAVISAAVEAESTKQLSHEYFVTTAYYVSGGERVLPASSADRQGVRVAVAARLVRARTAKLHTVLMGTRAACKDGADCLLEVDTLTGKAEIIQVGNAHTVNWAVDRDEQS
jgi:hypothetical protein